MSKRCLGCMEVFSDELQLCPHCGYIVGTPTEEAIHMVPGTILQNRYIVGKVLGYGGFGVTYIGWDGKLEQKVAVKEFLPGEFSTRMPGQSVITVFNGDKSEQFRDGMKKFVEEAKKLAKFQTESGIVKVLDSFEENSTAYIIMELLKGETLTDYLKRNGTVSADQAVQMLMPVMESLRNVHEKGLLHRDIAPDNIFITENNEVKLIDFGASRYATTSHSRSLTVIIKSGYSPEEQYRSRGDQGPYTDVYAIAATMYRMITGKNPPDAMERRAKYENDNRDILIPPHKLAKKIPKDREIALLNALNVRIQDRTQNIDEFIKELKSEIPVKRKYGKIKKIDVYMWPSWLKAMAASLAGIAAVFTVLLITGVISFPKFSDAIVIPDNFVSVPDVEGETADEAVRIIETGSLLAETGGTVESRYIEPGTIVLQNPVGGTYKELNSSVILTVSSGGKVKEAENGKSTVPFITWDTEKTASDKLKKAGLKIKNITKAHDESVKTGCVISQSLKAGTEVDEGTGIDLVISLGPSPFELPDVKGKKLEAAQETLKKLGLTVETEYGNDEKVEKGHVISQNIAPKTKVKRGDTVILRISAGKETVSVLNTEKSSREDAESKLKKQGFKVTVLENYDSEVEAGKVISQNPRPDSSQIKGAEITIVVSKGPQPVSVTLKADNGENDTTVTVNYKKTYGSLPVPHKKGCEFLGWFTEESGGSKISSGSVVENMNSHNLFAHWKVLEYTLTLDDGSKTETIKAVYGKTYTIPHPEKQDWYCTGWYTGSGSAVKEFSQNDTSSFEFVFENESDLTLQARWKKAEYKLTYYDSDKQLYSRNITSGDTYSHSGISTDKDYHTFKGWFTQPSGKGNQISSGDKFTLHENQNLYGYWEENPENDWVPESDVPENAKITQTKWVYTLTTTKSDWSVSSSGTHLYADYPQEFKQDHELRRKYNTSAVEGNEKAGVSKREVTSSEVVSRIFWHYSKRPDGSGPSDSAVSSYRDDLRDNTQFSAHEYNGDLTHDDGKGNNNNSNNELYFWNSGNADDVSYWWFSFDVIRQEYTDYSWETRKTTEKKESSTEVKNGGDISNVKKYVKYIKK